MTFVKTKILVVDDESAIRTLLRSAVAGPGFAVLEADGGPRALEVAAQEGPFELVVTDVLMPGMDGFELARMLSRAGHASNFLFISGYCDAETISERLGAFPGSGFLSKPFPIPEFLHVVHSLLAAPEAGRIELRRLA